MSISGNLSYKARCEVQKFIVRSRWNWSQKKASDSLVDSLQYFAVASQNGNVLVDVWIWAEIHLFVQTRRFSSTSERTSYLRGKKRLLTNPRQEAWRVQGDYRILIRWRSGLSPRISHLESMVHLSAATFRLTRVEEHVTNKALSKVVRCLRPVRAFSHMRCSVFKARYTT